MTCELDFNSAARKKKNRQEEKNQVVDGTSSPGVRSFLASVVDPELQDNGVLVSCHCLAQ